MRDVGMRLQRISEAPAMSSPTASSSGHRDATGKNYDLDVGSLCSVQSFRYVRFV